MNTLSKTKLLNYTAEINTRFSQCESHSTNINIMLVIQKGLILKIKSIFVSNNNTQLYSQIYIKRSYKTGDLINEVRFI